QREIVRSRRSPERMRTHMVQLEKCCLPTALASAINIGAPRAIALPHLARTAARTDSRWRWRGSAGTPSRCAWRWRWRGSAGTPSRCDWRRRGSEAAARGRATSPARPAAGSDALEHALFDDEAAHVVDAFACFEVGEDEGAVFAHLCCVASHDLERGADVGGQIGFVDHEQIAFDDAGAAFSEIGRASCRERVES